MFPGYLFFRAALDFPAHMPAKIDGVYKLLNDMDGEWRLSPQDQLLIEKLFERGGTIGLSKVVCEGGRIRPVDGLLKDYAEKIRRGNRRNRKAQAAFEIGQRIITTWLGFEETAQSSD